MHDIDRTMGRTNMEAFEFQGENEMNELYGESEAGELHGVQPLLQETELNEMATELLSVNNDRELEQFFGDIFKKVGSAVGSFIKSPVAKQLGGMLKGVAKQALPALGGALGNMVVPGVGGAIGSQLGSAAGSLFGLELEGLSNEDREFEVAKQFVRLTADAAQTAAHARGDQNPAAVAQHAIADAAQRYAPGLIAGPGGGGPSVNGAAGPTSSGRWIRKGRKLIVYGL